MEIPIQESPLSDEEFTSFTTKSAVNDKTMTFRGEGSEKWRLLLEESVSPSKVVWMKTGHTARAVTVGVDDLSEPADAYVTHERGVLLALNTADCLPIVMVDKSNGLVALIHAGWKGLVRGVIGNATLRFSEAGADLSSTLVWIGPSVTGPDYEVGEEVVSSLADAEAFTDAVILRRNGVTCADLPLLARSQLIKQGIPAHSIDIFPLSTKSTLDFHSVRRDGPSAGRMATIAGFPARV